MGKLVQVATNTVTSPTATVTLTGINSDDVYICTVVGAYTETDDREILTRVTKSGTADSTSNYDVAGKRIRADITFNNDSVTNADKFTLTGVVVPNNGYENINMILYLYNFNSASEYSFLTMECSSWYGLTTNDLVGSTGGGVHTVASASDGLHFFTSSGNIGGGTFTLYKVI